MQYFLLILLAFSCVYSASAQNQKISKELDDCKECVVLCEQSKHRIAIVDSDTKRWIWEWSAANSRIPSEHKKWFDFPDEAKPVYDNRYILMTASGGVVAMIRISDKKVVFYAFAGGNPHSAEVLPDGNIVSSSSTGNFLKLFKMDTTALPDKVFSKVYPVIDGHNVVWDKKRNVLWAGSDKQLYAYHYSLNCADPSLVLTDSITLPDNLHDLFPVHGQDALWLSTDAHVYRLDLATAKVKTGDFKVAHNIKSISSGPNSYATIVIQPKEKWWTDEVVSSTGVSIFREPELKIYKARWLLKNHFSYPDIHKFKSCDR
jgi:hypothetical protein